GVALAWREARNAWSETEEYAEKLEEAEGQASEVVSSLVSDFVQRLDGKGDLSQPGDRARFAARRSDRVRLD
ncbi:MAG: hypothetical protein AAF483_31450, partial [Planctomycetota bacterium]